jgi:hypothetical protein
MRIEIIICIIFSFICLYYICNYTENFDNPSTLSYSEATNNLGLISKKLLTGSITIPGKVNIDGNLTINGNVTINDDIIITGNLIVNGINILNELDQSVKKNESYNINIINNSIDPNKYDPNKYLTNIENISTRLSSIPTKWNIIQY